MKKLLCVVLLAVLCISLSGCSGWAVRTSSTTQKRVDQEVVGNRGVLFGKPASEPKEPAFTERKVYKVEVELPEWPEKLKVKKWNWKKIFTIKPRKPKKEDKTIWGNKGYLSKGSQQVPVEETVIYYEPEKEESIKIPASVTKETEVILKEKPSVRTYKTRKGDTLQKIARKFYGTTKKWPVIYKANRSTLKSPDKVYPGQVLIIPESAKSIK